MCGVSNSDVPHAHPRGHALTSTPLDDRVPVTILAGFLGSGKTTLLNRFVAASGDTAGDTSVGDTSVDTSRAKVGRLAVIVNEFGPLALDGRLIVGTTEEIVELRDGCVCCTVRGDLRARVLELLARRNRWWRPLRFDRIVIEASGLGSPGPVLQTFLLDAELAAATVPDGVVTVTHAGHVAGQIQEHPEVAEQLGYADVVLLNHLDQASDSDAAEAAVRAVNATARVVRTTRAEVPISTLLGLATTDPSRWTFPAQTAHTPGVSTIALEAGEVDLTKVKFFLHYLAARPGWRLYRLKGILRASGSGRPVIAHGIYQWLELGPGAGERPERSQVVVIGRDLDEGEVRRGWAVATG